METLARHGSTSTIRVVGKNQGREYASESCTEPFVLEKVDGLSGDLHLCVRSQTGLTMSSRASLKS